MSTLTKTLIVLLTLSSIFLCGIVVTYVGSADDYKQKLTKLKTDSQSAKKTQKSQKKQLEEKNTKIAKLEDKLSKKTATLKSDLRKVKANLKNSERAKATLHKESSKTKAITKDFYQTTDKQGQLLKNAITELNAVQTDQIEDRRQLNETTTALFEKMAIIESLEIEKRRLTEEKSDLQNRLDRQLISGGQTAIPVTRRKGPISRPGSTAKTTGLKGMVADVDLKHSMASISIGQADGVTTGMKFHITRGDEFLCDILIIDTDTEESVGVLELVQQNPKIGDNVSTDLL